MYRHVLQPVVNKTEFKPAADNRELPKAIKKILLPHRYWSVPRPLRPVQRDGLLVWCSYSQLYVMINRNIHGFRCKVSELSLGSCPVSRTTKKYFYFIYGLHECGNKVAVVDGQLAYSNTLRYAPATSQGPVIRSVPFSVPIQCRYNRFHYSYKMGFLPTWPRKQKFFKDLKNKYGFVLIPTDADWTRRAPKTTYYLGQPMYFQATAYIATGGQRLFIHSCYATPTPDHNSKPRFTVIDNFGCMVDGKMDGCGSRFIPYERKDVVRLTVDAFLFQKALSQVTYLLWRLGLGCSVSL
ncbi:ZP3 protein, partial [Amia calva]|nr:ZP3 protein [Amia calva]